MSRQRWRRKGCGKSHAPLQRIAKNYDTAVLNATRLDRPNRSAVALSFEEWAYVALKPCFYCGTQPACGLDRIDSGIKDYRWGNVLPCCTRDNRGKNVSTVEQYAAGIIQAFVYGCITNWGAFHEQLAGYIRRIEALPPDGRDQSAQR